ncbi:MAG: hypothetical protein FJ100_17460 [Deltaproteobacteria bacterium]|nr:hypothetical protein [Deltaproteobacteria bacterium]
MSRSQAESVTVCLASSLAQPPVVQPTAAVAAGSVTLPPYTHFWLGVQTCNAPQTLKVLVAPCTHWPVVGEQPSRVQGLLSLQPA